MSTARPKQKVVALRPTLEVYMILRDRKKLARLMVVQEVSGRQLADEIGWASHSYMSRLLRGDAKTVTPESAAKIAHVLQVPIDDLFQTKVDRKPGSTVQEKKMRRSKGAAA